MFNNNSERLQVMGKKLVQEAQFYTDPENTQQELIDILNPGCSQIKLESIKGISMKSTSVHHRDECANLTESNKCIRKHDIYR